MTKSRIFLLFFFALFSAESFAQHKIYKHLTSKDGLPSNTIYDMTQDENGYLLFATDNGLSKFSGTSFKTYSITEGLPDNEILKLFKDSQQRIWLMGFNGEIGCLYKGNFYNRHNTPYLNKLSFKNNVDTVYEDHLGNIWFYGRNNFLRCLTTNNEVLVSKKQVMPLFTKAFIEFDKQLYLLSNTPKNYLQKITIDTASIYIEHIEDKGFLKHKLTQEMHANLRNEGFYTQTDSLGMRFYNYAKTNTKGFNAFWPPKIFKESFNTYWQVSNFTGLYLTKIERSKLRHVFKKKDFGASAYYKDTEGNEWISSINDGVMFFPKTNIKIIDFDKTNNLKSVFSSNDTRIYVGDYQGNLSVVDNSNKPKYLLNNSQTKFSKSLTNSLNSILEYKNYIISIHNSDLRIHEREGPNFTGRYAILSIGGGKRGYILGNTLYLACSNKIYKLSLDVFIKQANWSNQNSTQFSQKYDAFPNNNYRKTIWENRSSAVLMDKDNRLWIGTNKGLYYLEKNTVNPFTSPSDFAKCNITDIKETSSGTVLVATNGYGLGVIEKNQSYFIHKIDEQINPIINSIKIDKDGHIWLATNTGISRFILKNKALSLQDRYTPLEGLSSKNIEDIVISDSLVYATSPKGLNIINTLEGKTDSKKNIPIHLDKMTINEQSKDSFDLNNLKHYQNDLFFSYTGVSFKSGSALKYKYRLDPWETKWVTTASKELRFSNLPPNTYTFEVKAINIDHAESFKPLQLSFTIHKAWYNYLAIKILAIGLLALLIWYFISNRIATIKIRSAYNEKIATLKHQALLAQMNPHFIYNTLSSIQQFILSNDTSQAEKQLTRFAKLLRTILANSKKTAISLTEEINLIENYLKLEQVRFDNEFQYNILCNVPEPDYIKIPPMIVQPLIENSIIHGISSLNKDQKGDIKISIIERGNYLECCVIDNGIGITTSLKLKEQSTLNTESTALSNIKERLALYNANDILISTSELVVGTTVKGTKVVVMIPILNYI